MQKDVKFPYLQEEGNDVLTIDGDFNLLFYTIKAQHMVAFATVVSKSNVCWQNTQGELLNLTLSVNMNELLTSTPGYSALHLAVSENMIEFVEALLARGAYISLFTYWKFGFNSVIKINLYHNS